MLEKLPGRPVRLIGAGLHRLRSGAGRQLSFDDLLPAAAREREDAVREGLAQLSARYALDFGGNLDRIFSGETLYRTVEYMRKHF